MTTAQAVSFSRPIIDDNISAMVARCTNMILRHAPRLMKTGGGGLRGQQVHRLSTPEERARAVQLYRELKSGKLVGEAIGRSPDWVLRVVRASGVEMRKPGGVTKEFNVT